MHTKDISTISLDSLADYPESLVKVTETLASLQGEFCAIKECKCHPYYDRTKTDYEKEKKLGTICIPSGFKTPLDFFETTTSEYIAKQFHHLPEIHIISLGSGQLLRELVIIAKLIKELKTSYFTDNKIVLHAVDTLYKKKNRTSSQHWLQISSYLCMEQFKELANMLNMNVDLLVYSSIEKYNRKRIIDRVIYPEVILSIDLTTKFDVDFPEKCKDEPSQKFEFTQQGILQGTKELAMHGSIFMTLTHLGSSKGMFIIQEKKENEKWIKEWIHTISSSKKIIFGPPLDIQMIIKKKNDEFLCSHMHMQEKLEAERFKFAPLSDAVRKRFLLIDEVKETAFGPEEKMIFDRIDELLKIENVNAQCTEGFTALHWAAMCRDEFLIKKLVATGADPTIKNIYGRTPLDYYQYQISLSDFHETFLDKEWLEVLSQDHTPSSPAIMPEFSQIYINDTDKSMALDFRNNESIDLSLFGFGLTSKSQF